MDINRWLRTPAFWGILLILGGIAMLIQNLVGFELGGLFWGAVFILAGVAFLAQLNRSDHPWWPQLPGIILLGIGASILLDVVLPSLSRYFGGLLVLGGIGLAFLLVYLRQRQGNRLAVRSRGVRGLRDTPRRGAPPRSSGRRPFRSRALGRAPAEAGRRRARPTPPPCATSPSPSSRPSSSTRARERSGGPSRSPSRSPERGPRDRHRGRHGVHDALRHRHGPCRLRGHQRDAPPAPPARALEGRGRPGTRRAPPSRRSRRSRAPPPSTRLKQVTTRRPSPS